MSHSRNPVGGERRGGAGLGSLVSTEGPEELQVKLVRKATTTKGGGGLEGEENSVLLLKPQLTVCLPACRGLEATRSTTAAAMDGFFLGWYPRPNAASLIVVTYHDRWNADVCC